MTTELIHQRQPDTDALINQISDYAHLATRFGQATIACQIMAGFALLDLKRAVGRGPGRASASDDSATWEQMVEIHCGISTVTAWRWMRMAHAVKPRLKRLAGADRLRALLDSSPLEWSHDDSELLHRAIEHITDGRTQTDFMAEIGLLKKSPGGRRAKHTSSNTVHCAEPVDPIAPADPVRDCAIKDWAHIERLIQAYDHSGLLAALDPAHLQAQCAALEMALQRRRELISP